MNKIDKDAIPVPDGPAEIIDSFRRRIRGIRICAREIIPNAKKLQAKQFEAVSNEIVKYADGLKDPNPRKQSEAIVRLKRDASKVILHGETPYDELILESFLKSAFGSFDAFVGAILRRLYRNNKMLQSKIEKQLSIEDLHDVSSVEDAKSLVVEKEIDSLLRESYPTQFSQLASRFGVKSLTDFPNWPSFVEASQRRNIVTHCEGRVNVQYMSVCKKHHVTFGDDVSVGAKLPVTLDYLCATLDILYEVGFKLGQVLWRKACPDERDAADGHLANGVVEILQREEWAIAKNISEFGVRCVKPFNDRNKMTLRVNYAQSLLWAGDKDKALEFLDKYDWTGTVRDFQLAVAVLRERNEVAGSLMRKIGQEGEVVGCAGYIGWPIFREFRKTSQFREAFKDVYGVPFEDEATSELKSLANVTKKHVTKKHVTKKHVTKKHVTKKHVTKKKATKKKATKK